MATWKRFSDDLTKKVEAFVKSHIEYNTEVDEHPVKVKVTTENLEKVWKESYDHADCIREKGAVSFNMTMNVTL